MWRKLFVILTLSITSAEKGRINRECLIDSRQEGKREGSLPPCTSIVFGVVHSDE